MYDNLMTTNVYSCKGNIVITGTCLPTVSPEGFAAVAEGAEQIYSLCLEDTHINMAITKIAAILGTGQVTSIRFVSVDRSPHCTQLHYIRHEIERTMPEHIPMEDWVVVKDRPVRVTEQAIELSKSLAVLSEL